LKLWKSLTAALPAILLVAGGTIGLGAAELAPQAPRAGRQATPLGVLVFGRDALESVRVVAAADGRLIGFGGWLHVAVAASDDPDFADRLYRAGATLVFRADGAVGCNDLKRARPRQDG
jgi:hypothetical protein